MEPTQANQEKSVEMSDFKKFMRSYTARIIISVLIILVLLIPTAQVSFLIQERKMRQDEVTAQLEQEWGPEFRLYGMILEIPKKNKAKDFLYVCPELSEENISANVNERYRGIFKANLFTSKLTSVSTFQLEKLRSFKNSADLDWNNARLILVTGKSTRFTELSNFKVNDRSITVAGQDGNYTTNSYSNQFIVDASVSSLTVKFDAEINGTASIIYHPTASQSSLQLTSNWMDPAFSGSSLPLNGSFKKSEKGVSAQWKNLTHIGNGSRSVLNHIPLNNSSVSKIEFITMLDQYQLNERTIKYAILVLTLTFAVFFLVQIVGKTVVHPIHFLLIGLALLLFYSLLLSLSEHIGFNGAYFVSSGAIVVLIIWYAKSILNSLKFAIICGISIALLYAFLLVLVNLEVYALLVGSIGLLLVLATIMSVTRKLKFE